MSDPAFEPNDCIGKVFDVHMLSTYSYCALGKFIDQLDHILQTHKFNVNKQIHFEKKLLSLLENFNNVTRPSFFSLKVSIIVRYRRDLFHTQLLCDDRKVKGLLGIINVGWGR